VVQAAPAPPTSRILTKEPEFWPLLHPPEGDALLEMSTEYAAKKKEIESKLAAIQDPELRKRVSDEEWAKLDKSVYINKEGEHLRASLPSAFRAFLEKHRGDWFEVGHVRFPGTNLLAISPIEASPLQLNEGASVPMDVATMDGVYSKFREIARQQIEQASNAWIEGQLCSAKLKIVCQNLGGSSSDCSNPATLSEIEARLGAGLSLECNDHPSPEEGRKMAEEQLRENRLVLVGAGDLIDHRIDKLMLVDYDTESILLELPPKVLDGKLDWKFPAEDQPRSADLDQATLDYINAQFVPTRIARNQHLAMDGTTCFTPQMVRTAPWVRFIIPIRTPPRSLIWTRMYGAWLLCTIAWQMALVTSR
jgi:hypothetical protein